MVGKWSSKNERVRHRKFVAEVTIRRANGKPFFCSKGNLSRYRLRASNESKTWRERSGDSTLFVQQPCSSNGLFIIRLVRTSIPDRIETVYSNESNLPFHIFTSLRTSRFTHYKRGQIPRLDGSLHNFSTSSCFAIISFECNIDSLWTERTHRLFHYFL